MDFDASVPIWTQLLEEFRSRIATSQWPPGSKLPSVRELAVEFGVNPNTVQRALSELDRLGLTEAQRTAGRFVTATEQQTSQERRDLATDAVDACVTALKGLGLGRDDATALVNERWDAADRQFSPAHATEPRDPKEQS